MEFSPRPRSGEYRRFSLDSDFGLSSSTSTIDPNDTAYSDCSSNLSLNSTLEDDVFVQSLTMRTESLDTIFGSLPEEVLSFNNTSALCRDMRLVDEESDWCDIRFLAGEEKIPVYGVRGIICARSRVLCSIVLTQGRNSEMTRRKRRKRVNIARLVKSLFRLNKNWRSGLDRTKEKEDILTIEIPEFHADVFRQVVHFLHSGTISIQLSNVVGVMAAADVYGLEELRSACYEFARGFITKKTVLQLLDSALPYQASNACVKLLEQVLHFVDQTSDEILQLPSFLGLSRTNAILILSRRTLRVTDEAKWDAALRWSREHCDGDVGSLRECLKSFTPNIDMLQIPLSKLMEEITPLCSKRDEGTELRPDMRNISDVSLPTWDPISLLRQPSLSSACSKFSLASYSTDSGYMSSFRESCLL